MVCLTLSLPVFAAQYCAKTVTQISNALALAENNNEDNHIRIARGVIAPNEPYQGHLFLYISSKDRLLEISGGWDTQNCVTQRMDPSSTVLAANDSLGVFQLLIGSAGGNARLRLHNLTISGSHNYTTHGRGAAVNVVGFQNAHGKVEIERVVFADHHCSGPQSEGCALYLGSGIKEATIRNSLFHNNSANRAGAIRALISDDIQPLFRLHNNTIVENFAHASTAAMASAVEFTGANDMILMYNNIVFNNQSLNASVPLPDLARDAGAILGKHNNIATSSVVWADSTSGNRSIPPVFAGRADDYRLRGDSPLRDVGYYTGWPTHGLLELGGGPRVLGPTIDLGAYESDVLFNSGFGD